MNKSVNTKKVLFLFGIIFSVKSVLAMDISTRVAARFFLVNNYLTNETISARALRLRLTMNNILNSGFNFNVHFRNGSNPYNTKIPYSKLYDLNISNNNFLGGFGVTIGRFNSPIVGAYGILDGISLKYNPSDKYSLGAFWGAAPDLITFEPNIDLKRMGAFFQINYIENYQSNISFIYQSYLNKLDRIYLYFDNYMHISNAWSFPQFAELDLVEKPKEDVITSLNLTNMFADIRYAPNKVFNITLNYNNHKDYKYLESMDDIPDSLFQSAVDQSFGARINVRPYSSWRIYGNFRYGLRTDEAGRSILKVS